MKKSQKQTYKILNFYFNFQNKKYYNTYCKRTITLKFYISVKFSNLIWFDPGEHEQGWACYYCLYQTEPKYFFILVSSLLLSLLLFIHNTTTINCLIINEYIFLDSKKVLRLFLVKTEMASPTLLSAHVNSLDQRNTSPAEINNIN